MATREQKLTDVVRRNEAGALSNLYCQVVAMKCDRCKNKTATIHLTQITGDDVVAVNLCSNCARQVGINGKENINANLLSALKLFAREMESNPLKSGPENRVDPALKTTRCVSCGLTGEAFSQTGLLGCPNCYQTFADQLTKDFQAFHRHTRHHGRGLNPVNSTVFAHNMALAKLRESLQHAVHKENYEKAAQLRDRIFSLEQGTETREGRQ